MKDSIRALKKELGDGSVLTLEDLEYLVRTYFKVVSDELVAGGKISIPSFGIFETKETKATKRRNPKTGEPIVVPAGKKATFRFSSKVKDAVKES